MFIKHDPMGLNECMKMQGPVLVLLLGDDILLDGVLLLEVLQCRLWGDITFRECEEPAFSSFLLLVA